MSDFYRVFLNNIQVPNGIFIDRRLANDYAIYYGESIPNSTVRIDKYEVFQIKDLAYLWKSPFFPSQEILVTCSYEENDTFEREIDKFPRRVI